MTSDLEARLEHLEHLQSGLEKIIETNEQITAQLLLAYGEFWAMLEALTSVVMNNKTEAEQEQFAKTFADYRKNLTDHLRKSSHDMGNIPSDVTEPLEQLVRQDGATPSS